MAYPKVKGSIIAKVLVVILGISLIFALYMPAEIWDLEEADEAECRFRMVGLLNAQSQYFSFNRQFADSLEQIKSFAASNPDYVQMVDSLAVIASDEDAAEREKNGIPLRPYHSVPVTIDSLYRCPTQGEFYIISSEEEGRFKIDCPTEEGSLKIYRVFERFFYNHGWIDQNRNISW